MDSVDLLRNMTFLKDSDFEEFIQQDKVTLLVFFSGSHIGCRRQIQLVVDFAKKYGDIYNVAVVDVGQNPLACVACAVTNVPHLTVVRRGVILGSRRGGLEKDGEAELLSRLGFLQKMDMSTG